MNECGNLTPYCFLAKSVVSRTSLPFAAHFVVTDWSYKSLDFQASFNAFVVRGAFEESDKFTVLPFAKALGGEATRFTSQSATSSPESFAGAAKPSLPK